MNRQFPEGALLRLPQIIGQSEVTEVQAAENRKRGKGPRRARTAIPAIIPIGKTSWWEMVRDGRAPKPIKLGTRATAWRGEDIRALLQSIGGGE